MGKIICTCIHKLTQLRHTTSQSFTFNIDSDFKSRKINNYHPNWEDSPHPRGRQSQEAYPTWQNTYCQPNTKSRFWGYSMGFSLASREIPENILEDIFLPTIGHI